MNSSDPGRRSVLFRNLASPKPRHSAAAAALILLAIACVTASPLSQTDPDDPCQAARSGSPPFETSDIARGEQRFHSDCAECHSLTASKAGLPGPPLRGVVSRPIGQSGTHGYSAAFRGRNDYWTLAALDQYIEDPQWFIPGTRMKYTGLPDATSRLDLLAFLSCNTADR